MANFGFAQHQQMLLKLCRICDERLMKKNDKYEKSFSYDDKRDLIFDSFAICTSFKEYQKPGGKKKFKPGVKSASNKDVSGSKKQTEIVEGMSGTLSFQPGEKVNLFSLEVQELKTYRGTEPLFAEHFSENIKHEYICPFRKVLDQPVQTKILMPSIPDILCWLSVFCF